MLLLLLSAALLGSTAGSADSPVLTSLRVPAPDISTGAPCLEGGEHTVTRGLRIQLQSLQQQLIDVQRWQLAAVQQQEIVMKQQQTAVDQLTMLATELTAVLQPLEAAAEQSPACATSSCPDGWDRNGTSCLLLQESSSLYPVSLFRGGLSWPEAQQACAALDSRAQLASVHQGNQEHVASVVVSKVWDYAGYPFVWIGMQRFTGGWRWSDGSPTDFTNWEAGQPEDLDEAYNCVTVSSRTGEWHDAKCSNGQPFLCQICSA